MATLVQTKSLLNDFRKWLKSNQCISSGGNYNSWLINFPSRLIYKPLPYPNYLDTITDLILAGYPVYAVGLCDKVMSILQTNLNACTNKSTRSYLQNAQSSLYQFRAYLCSQLFPLVPPPVPTLSPAVLKAAKGVAKGKLEGIIDGTNTLLNGALAHARINFVKLAIESSLFFSADIVGERCNELSKMFNSKANVPARYTDDKTICTAPVKGRPAVYNIVGKSYNVIVDKDGNDFVRKLINDKTGYTVSTGKSSVVEEFEAHEFTHHLLNRTLITKTKAVLYAHKRAAVVVFVLVMIALLTVGYVYGVSHHIEYADDFYITPTGLKYHRAACSAIKGRNSARKMTKEEYDSGQYEPCSLCVPED